MTGVSVICNVCVKLSKRLPVVESELSDKFLSLIKYSYT